MFFNEFIINFMKIFKNFNHSFSMRLYKILKYSNFLEGLISLHLEKKFLRYLQKNTLLFGWISSIDL